MPSSPSGAPSIKHEKSSIDEKVVELPSSPEQKSVSFFQLFRYSTRFEIFLDLIGVLAAVISGAAQPLLTLIFGRLTQNFVNFNQILTQARNGVPGAEDSLPAAAEKFRHDAANNAAAVVYIGLGLFACTYVYMNIWIYTGEVNAKRIRERYLQAILRQDIAFFDNVGPGEITARIQTDTHLVQQGISEKVPLVAFILGAFTSAFIIAYVRSWRLALALTSMVPCMGIAGTVMNSLGVKYKQASLGHIANGSSIAEEVVSTIRVAQAFGTQTILSRIYGTQINKAKDEALKGTISHGGAIGVYYFVMYSCYALAFNFGTTLINSNRANAGEVINVFMSILFGALCLGLLPPELQVINNGRSAAAKLYDSYMQNPRCILKFRTMRLCLYKQPDLVHNARVVLENIGYDIVLLETIDRIPVIDSADPGGLKPDDVVGEIVLDNVRFSYPSRPAVEVTKGISITFQAGKTSALVGASGSGKSTIVSLIERFYNPTSGLVKLDGRDVRDLNIKWLRSQIGLVSQEPTLFSTTITQNVAYGLIGTKHEHASEEEKAVLVRRACVKANADGFINQLPRGYDTLVGERGVLLSGGQRQRVAIARAIVSEPQILLLDEATSALDTQSEELVQDALDKAAAGRTTITIAHRLSTIKDADVIYVMGDGLVLESGTHSELLQRPNGAYAKLVEAQKLRDGDGIEPSKTEMHSEMDNRQEQPLERKYTNHSNTDDATYASPGMADSTEGDYNILYVMKRMAIIGRIQMRHYVFGFLLPLINGMVYPAFAIVFGKGIVGFSLDTKEGRRHAGDRTALWLFLMAIISSVTNGNSDRSFQAASVRMTALLRDLSFKSVIRQDISFFDKTENTTGHLVSQMTDNPEKVEALTGMTLNAILQLIASIIVGSVVGLIFVWKVGLVGIATTPFILIAGFLHMRVITEKDQKNKKAHAQSAHIACEAAQSVRTVAALTMEDNCLRLYSESLEGPLRRSARTSVVSGVLFGVSQGISFFAIALIFWYGSLLVSRREVSLFHFFVGLMSTSFNAIQAGNVLQFIPDISSARSASSDIIRLLDSVPEIDAESQSGKVVDAEKIQGHVRFENVHFRYPTRTEVPVLRGLSLEAHPGSYIALVGASGSGKSTAIQLMERFYDPLRGSVYLDGQRIDELNIQEYRKNLALVSQEPTLYSGTIKFNILLGAIKPHDEVTMEEIESACRDANILDFIRSLPEGFDTEVGGKGALLSGGQKQRIAIARALLRDPKILLLDEATSALDSASEKVVQAALDHASRGRTTIAIAHRLSTIQNADRIYFLKDGRVSEQGTHDELLAQKGNYFQFVMLQGLNKG